MRCSSCGTDNDSGRKFCGECGAALALVCPSCGSANTPGVKFCGECGAAVAASPPTPARRTSATERKHVSVLFADLVGFTTASEGRDAEDTRALLSRYFETCQRLISLYGGTVEKFIGDAVMAVWGTPVANEDDAERAVRTALDMVAAVPDLDPALKARAGVLTGEAAVTLGVAGEGMVAGDLVNTASRIQALAEPGTVLVGEETRHATAAAIAYEPVGEHELKGKADSVALFRALRVLAARGGAQRSEGLEPPFVGRDRELRLVKELLHASAEERRAHLVSVVGIAGIGKSRLAWEFEKYVDGLVDTFWWHRGRCLAYGEGVAYWALAEMVRRRAGMVEAEDPASARDKLRDTLVPIVENADERAWIEPRLAHLLGLEERSTHERDDLFAAWRLFYERLSETQPTILVFEDVQWADASLLEFVEYLLEWSRNYPIFVVCLARPELAEQHPDFGKSQRNATTLSLEPLSAGAMEQLLDGFVPGLPAEPRTQILERAEGVPLYAVETVRMLLNRGLLEREGEVYRPTGPIEQLEVPETLHALIAARLDGLSREERRLVQDASVLGKMFTKPGLAALSGLPEQELEPLLASLLRKEVLTVQADPRSPERGQYGFLQDLLKRVAYETLSRKERRTLHLAAAEYLEGAFGAGEQEIIEVVAAHYVDAYESAPDAPDATAIRQRAHELLARAAERAASLAAAEEAQRYFDQAAELANEPLQQARMRERSGEMAWLRGTADEAQKRFEEALAQFEAQGQTHAAARVSARLGEVEWRRGHLEQAIERMEGAYEVLVKDEPDEDLAAFAAQLGRLYWFHSDVNRASERVETALEIAETLWLPEVLAQALITKGIVADTQGRSEESLALLKHALEITREHDIPSAAARAYHNFGDTLARRDRYEEALEAFRSGIGLARRTGNLEWELTARAETAYILALIGAWPDALEELSVLGEMSPGVGYLAGLLTLVPELLLPRGALEQAKVMLADFSRYERSDDIQERSGYAAARASVLRAEGKYLEALSSAEDALAGLAVIGAAAEPIKCAFVESLEAALALGRGEKVDRILEQIDALRPCERTPFLQAQAARFRAHAAAVAEGPDRSVEQGFKTAEQIFREYSVPFWLAVTQLEHAEWLSGQGRSLEADPLLAEARGTFERLEAAPWLDRAGGALATAEVGA
jgi:class 3 adenylate cyclase/tetratricopeptide (TPR) repeat protein